MGYELIITEKPNAAKKIADALADGKALKENKNKIPYYNLTHGNQDIIVACAVGHLYTVAEKNKKAWTYPIFDIEWVPSSNTNKAASFTKKYLQVIKSLAKDAKDITVATDYDIEGEVIGWSIVTYGCKKKDANRMKFSTLTKEDLVKSYDDKKNTLDWGQANAGKTRHEMDWLYGINLSRALTLSIKNATQKFKILSSGRVQGPALKILVDKEKEISDFKPDPFWQLQLDCNAEKKMITSLHEKDKFWEKEEVTKIFENIKSEKKAKVEEISKKQTKQSPPVPFDLTSLQLEAHKTIRVPPKQTLELAQKLYLEGVISYPRTSSQKLPASIGYKKILTSLGKQQRFEKEVKFLLSKKKLVPNEGKKEDAAHPAIYPTGFATKSDDPKAKQLYELIVRRFLAVFGDPATRETMKIKLNVKDEIFVTSGTRTVENGWFELYDKFVMLKDEELPKLEHGQELSIKKIEVLDKETQPPRRYTAASIIKELEKRGLGTKSTRAQIIDNLYSRGYVNEKSIQATELGIRTCGVLEKYCPEILDEKLTRDFEDEMEEIRQSKKTSEQILEHVQKILKDILDKFKKNEKKIGEELYEATVETRDELSYIGKCPNCDSGELHIRRGRFGQFIACNKYPDCKTTFGLPSAMIKNTDKICEHCGLPIVMVIKKRKRPQELCINSKCPSKMTQDPEKIKEMNEIENGDVEKECPKCKDGQLVVRKSIYGAFLGCNKYPKCRYTEKIEEGPLKEDFEKKEKKTKTNSK